MLDPQATSVLLAVISVCLVILTVLAIAITYAVIIAALEVRRLAGIVRTEAEHLIAFKNKAAKSIRFSGRLVRIFGRNIMR